MNRRAPEPLNAGLDLGSTTLKLVIVSGAERRVIFSHYQRHRADLAAALRDAWSAAATQLGADTQLALTVTGSAGLGLAEARGLPFLQETVAAAEMARRFYPLARSLADIGGEDAKLVLFAPDRAPDIRMNGSCAGGTGAFLDQVAALLGCDTAALDELARGSRAERHIASRCGVFAKTDIQNLLSRGVAPADIAAAAFRAVAQQIATTLARGCDITPPLLLCGGPLAMMPALRAACCASLGVSVADCVVPEHAALASALGCAVADGHERRVASVSGLLEMLAKPCSAADAHVSPRLPPLFDGQHAYENWRRAKQQTALPLASLADYGGGTCALGIDSGSTTTKIVAVTVSGEILFTHYAPNNGDPLRAASEGLAKFHAAAVQAGKPDLRVSASVATGYGEDLMRAALGLDAGLVETVAHYEAARRLAPDVSFILDIGGQDMKAVFAGRGAITRIELNEACSAGCGSFLDTFARSLNLGAAEFASLACRATRPCDLGTRCTVFMNSKVRQALRESAPRADIAAGLAYAVAKNCLFKVLRLRNTDELGGRVVAQGGVMRNDAVVRALELVAGREITVAPLPELMGACGAAWRALALTVTRPPRPLAELARPLTVSAGECVCPGCANHCRVTKHRFASGNEFFSGNQCEKVFINSGDRQRRGANMFPQKLRLLFARPADSEVCAKPRGKIIFPKIFASSRETKQLNIGIPRVLNYYENFPFWHTLLVNCGARVTLSAPSTPALGDSGAASVMSDNICFPAKLAHGHVLDLLRRGVDRVLMPFAVRERDGAYNCPVVSGYADVIRSAINPAGRHGVPLDAPELTFSDRALLKKSCREYAVGTLGIIGKVFETAFALALAAQENFSTETAALARRLVADSDGSRPLIVLAGRPYHADPLIQRQAAELFASLGADVVSEDIARSADARAAAAHWSYPGRLRRAAAWVAAAPPHVHLVQLTSFGCGPDAFMLDEISAVLRLAGKSHTVLKVDDILSTGALKLRARSLIESLSRRGGEAEKNSIKKNSARDFSTADGHAIFTAADRQRTLLVPFFSEFHSPFIPPLLERMGCRARLLPPPDEESAALGLRYANNEVCYPATLIVGDFLRALRAADTRRDRVALAITQTGGQCRASAYVALIKRAVAAAGFADVPVVAVGTNIGAVHNEQPGFNLRWCDGLRLSVSALFYADRLAQMYYAAAPREAAPGATARLRDQYLAAGVTRAADGDAAALPDLLRAAAADFNRVTLTVTRPRLGIVGEIYVKYSAAGNRRLADWLIAQGVEPVIPPLADFFLQEFPNRRHNRARHLAGMSVSGALGEKIFWHWLRHRQRQFDRAAADFQHHQPAADIFARHETASRLVTLAAQYGEGWLIPAELASFAERGINHAVSVQPFGCLANHLVAKGLERRLRDLYPRLNLLCLDFDTGASEANVFNRLHFLIHSAKEDLTVSASSNSKGMKD